MQVTRLLLEMVDVANKNGLKLPREFGLLLKQSLYFNRWAGTRHGPILRVSVLQTLCLPPGACMVIDLVVVWCVCGGGGVQVYQAADA